MNTRRAWSLLLVLVLAKAATALLRAATAGVTAAPASLAPASPWEAATSWLAAPAALASWIYQDLWVVAGFAVLDITLAGLARLFARRPPAAPTADGWMWAAYALVVAYTAVNVPLAAVLGSPLTAPMLAGAGGTLSDSIRPYVTPVNVAAIAAIAGAGAVVPWGLLNVAGWGKATGLRSAVTPTRPLALAAIAIMVVGPWVPADGASAGFRRNAVATLAETAWRRWGGAGWMVPTPATAAPAALPPEGDAVDLRRIAGGGAGLNVVWIVLESAGARYLKPYGAAVDPMPNVTALAERGIVFDHAYAVYPESIKGLYALLCSAEPAAYVDASRYAARRLPCPDFAGRLREAGYQTALFHSGRFIYLGMGDVVADRGFDRTLDAGDVGGRFASSFGVDEVSTVARVLDFVDRRDPGRPFFVMYLPIAGHHPYESPGDAPRPFGEADDFHRYQSDLFMADAAVGTLIRGLRDRGLGERTLWVVSGDHGQAFFQHEGNFAHSFFIYEENVHIPLIIAAPGWLGQARTPQIAGAIDIAPTVLDMLGLPIPAAYHGRSLLDPTPGLARFYTDHTVWRMGLRQGRWKYILDAESGDDELFDLEADPGERRDVAALHPDRAARYRDHLRRWAAARAAAVTAPRLGSNSR